MTSQHREGQVLMEAVMDEQPAQGGPNPNGSSYG